MKQRISGAIRQALDERGIEITWSDTDAAAEAVMKEIENELDDAWRYEQLN